MPAGNPPALKCRSARTASVRLLLYGTAGCHLCEQAEALLEGVARHTSRPLEILHLDIAAHPDLVDRYGLRIPVFREESSGIELGWPFNAEQLRDYLESLHRQ